jgi:hypothetical protein
MRAAASQGAQDWLTALHGQTPTGHGSGGVFVLLTLLVPFAAALLQYRSSASAIWEQLQQAREHQRQWDQAAHEALLVRERRGALLRLAEAERAQLERRREEARRKIRALAEQAHASERWIRATLEAERRFGVAYGHSLVAALEQDRYFFLKAARKRRPQARAGEPPWGRALGPAALLSTPNGSSPVSRAG